MAPKFFWLVCFSALISLQTFAQPALQWDKRFNGSIGNDQGNAVAVDASGNVYVAASSDGSNFMSDYLIIKYNSNGDTLWSIRYNGSANGIDAAVAIKADASGNVYATGYSQSTGTGYDIVTLKYNAQGVQQWAKVFDGGNSGANKDDMGYDLEVDIAGNVYVAGSSYPVGGAYPDGVVIKYNPMGTLLWKININESPNYPEVTNLIRINSIGNIIVTEGISNVEGAYVIFELNPANGAVVKEYNIYTFPPGLFPVIGFPNDIILNPNNNDMYVVSSGNQLGLGIYEVHTARFLYGGTGTRAWDATQQVSSSAFISGVDIDIDANLNTYVVSDYNNGSSHYFRLVKYNSSGATQWAKLHSANSSAGNIPVSLSLSNEVSNPSIFVAGSIATGDINIVKFNNNGDTLWQKIYDCGNNGPDIASKMITDDCDNIYITGSSNCNATGRDVKTIKYSTNAPTITAGDITTFCQGDSVTLESSPANAYLWSTGATTQSITVKTSGNYSVTVTYANGCSAASPVVAVEVNPAPSPPVITVVGNSPTTFCQGGSVTLTSSPASSYLWSNGAITQNITVTTSGNYSVTVSSVSGCSAASTATTVIVIPAPPPPNITIVGSTTFCQGGSVMLTASAASSYLWSNGATTQSITVSTAGLYSVTVSNAAGCTAASLSAVSVTVLTPPTATVTPDGPTTFCQGGSVTLMASSASSYLWSNGATTQNITIAASGQYSVTVANANGCTAASLSAVSVTVLPPPTATVTPDGLTTFCQGGSVTLTASSASSYLWSNGATTKSITVSTAGQYSVTVTDLNGCTGASPATTVTVIPPPTATVTPAGTINLCEGESVTLTASTASFYLWSNGPTTQSISVSTTGMYSVTVTGANSCTAASPATSVVVHPLPEAIITASGDIAFCQGGSVTLTSNSASSYKWSSGATTQSITVATGGNYSVTITDANGCTDASPPTLVTVHPLPAVDLGDDITLTQGDSAILSVGQWSEYEWSTGATTPTITVYSMGTYFVTVTNSFGCTAFDSIVVTVTSSTTDFDNRYRIIVFPNPAQQAVNIRCKGGATTSVQVFDNFGRLVLEDNSFAPDGALRSLLLGNVPSGRYYMRVAGEAFVKAISVVKQ